MLERSASSPTMNHTVVKNNNLEYNAMTPLRQNRLAPPAYPRSAVSSPNGSAPGDFQSKQRTTDKKGNCHKAEAVKMWIMKGMVQVTKHWLCY